MDLGDVAGVVLKAGSLSGLGALGWQLWNAWDARRGRLSVETKRYGDRSFTAVVSYMPKDHHMGLIARAKVLHPAAGKVAGLERTGGGVSLRDEIAKAVRQLQAARSSEVRLRHNEGIDPEGVYRGDLFVTDLDETAPAATLQISIWTTGYPKRIASRRFKLSPID